MISEVFFNLIDPVILGFFFFFFEYAVEHML